MEARATAKVKITATPEVVKTIKAYTKGLQFCVNTAWKQGIKNNVRLHPFVYAHLRKTLPSQIAVACIKQACGMVKKAKHKPIINHASVGFNFPRSAKLKGDVLTLRLLKKRQSFKLTVADCYKQYFSWKLCESLLRIDKRGRCFFLFIFSKEVDVESSCFQNRVLGIDLGVNNLAVTSDGRFYGSAKVKQGKRKFRYLRSKLQAKGTRSARKLLRKLSGREKRFMAWVNHNVSKNIVAKFDGNKIVMEDLKGIRKVRRGKRMNYWISNWSFFQLQNFIQYKAERKGIEVVKVNPAYTSQICHRCGHLGSRSFGCFSCHCGLHDFNSDLNASRNLSHPMLGERQAVVTQPYIQSDDVKGVLSNTTAIELMDKSPTL